MNISTPHLPPLPETADIAERDLLGGLEKGLRVIEAFDQDRPRLTISEVALRTGLSRAAVRRCLLTLVHLGYARQDERHFSLSPKVMRLGQSYMHSAKLPRAIQPQLQRIAMAMQEAGSVGVLDGDDVIAVAAVTADRRLDPLYAAALQSATRSYCETT